MAGSYLDIKILLRQYLLQVIFLKLHTMALVRYAAWDIADKTTEAVRNRDLSEQEETSSGTIDIFPDKQEIDINRMPNPVDDSGYKKPDNFLAFQRLQNVIKETQDWLDGQMKILLRN